MGLDLDRSLSLRSASDSHNSQKKWHTLSKNTYSANNYTIAFLLFLSITSERPLYLPGREVCCQRGCRLAGGYFHPQQPPWYGCTTHKQHNPFHHNIAMHLLSETNLTAGTPSPLQKRHFCKAAAAETL